MLKVLETFSGIGSQVKALKRINEDFEIVATVEWDINAIYAYDIIHNGAQDLTPYIRLSKIELIDKLKNLTLSYDGKKPMSINSLKIINEDSLRRILCAIERTNNLVNIMDVKASDLPNDIDVLTYSFPCQDLSISGSWHGNMSGINRHANNRSGMLWEIERILKEFVHMNKKLPKFLLMENVTNILSETHRHNFDEWKNYLLSIGYFNKVYTLNSYDFGIPQKRIRTFMVSVYIGDEGIQKNVECFFESNDLALFKQKLTAPLASFLCTDYSDQRYFYEAEQSNPNFTISRRKIFSDNSLIYDGMTEIVDSIKTITTKQDRNPNSGILKYNGSSLEKAPYRNLTPRECFLLMGFDEEDFQSLIDNDFNLKKGQNFCSKEKLIKLAGNSIVVNVLEEIFKQIIFVNKFILPKKNEKDKEKLLA